MAAEEQFTAASQIPRPTRSRVQERHGNLKKRNRIKTIIPVISAVIGIVLLLYPVFATRHNNQVQQELAWEYTATVTSMSEADRTDMLQKAKQYNDDLFRGVILDPFLVDVIPDSPEYQAYLQQLSFDKIMATMTIPDIKVSLPVYHGTSDSVLKKGIGHLFGTSLPVGGKGSHSVVTAHTGLVTATMFDNLDKVEKGDPIYVNVYGERLKYEVYEIEVVKPENTESLNRVPGRDLLTLITCTPYGVNSHRLLVHAERVEFDPEQDSEAAEPKIYNPWTYWMIGLLALAIVSTLIVIWAMFFRKSKHGKTGNVGDVKNQEKRPRPKG